MILIVDCYLDEKGGTSNFARQLRGKQWVSVRPTREPLPKISDWSGVIITGSGACLADGYEGEGLRKGWTSELVAWTKKIVDADIPLLGVCFGHQILGAAYGNGVQKAHPPEVGCKKIKVVQEDPLFHQLQPYFYSFVSHEDEIRGAGDLIVLASSEDCEIHAVRVPNKKVWGVQFHVEMLSEEIENLLRYRKQKHSELDIDIEHELSILKSNPPIATTFFSAFLRQLDT